MANTVSWTDVNINNIIDNGPRVRQPKRRPAIDGYQSSNIGQDMDNYLMAQTSYINAMQTIAEVGAAIDNAIHHIVLTQMGMKAGIRAYGEESVELILKETNQFHDREVVNPLRPSEITPEIRNKVLGYLMFLKMKTNSEIKSRGCAD